MRRLLSGLAIVVVVLLIGVVLVIYAEGKRFGTNGKLVGTGIIQIGSKPQESLIYLNNVFKGKTDTNLENIKSGTYTIRIQKDHYRTWQKEVEVKEGLVTPLNVTLFPSNPSLTAISFDGVYSPKISPDKKRVVFGIQEKDKAGLWVIDLTDRQLFFDSSHLRKIASDSDQNLFSSAVTQWSSDNNSVIATLSSNGVSKTYSLKQDQSNENPEIVTLQIDTLRDSWKQSLQSQNTKLLSKLGVEAIKLAMEAESISFSKDNSSVIIINKDKSAIVYDTRPTPVPNSKPLTYSLPVADSYFWFPDDSKHIVAVEKNTISLMDNDGGNKISIFTGDFDPTAVYAWPDGSRLVVSINLNSKSNHLPNFYTLDLR